MSENLNQSTPAGRMMETAQNMVTLITENLTGMQGTLLRPMLGNYLGALSSALTDKKALDFVDKIQYMLDYVRGDSNDQSSGDVH